MYIRRGNLFGKIFVSSLLATLFGLVALIIMKSFDLFDLSASLQKAKFSEIIDEWMEYHDVNIASHEIKVYDVQVEPFNKDEYGNNFENLEKNVVSYHSKELQLQKEEDQSSENINAAAPKENTLTTEIIVRSKGSQILDHEITFIEAELERANEEIIQNNLKAGAEIYESLAFKYPDSPAALYGKIKALSSLAFFTGSSKIYKEVVKTCLHYLVYDGNFNDEDFEKISYYCIDKMRVMKIYQPAIKIHLLLIKRFDDDPKSRNELAETYIILRRYSDAQDILKENIKRWPNNGLAMAKYGYILLNDDCNDEGIHYLRLGIWTGDEGTQETFFYCRLGDAFLHSNRTDEAREVFRHGVAQQVFENEYQRTTTYVKGLKAQPIWTKEETTYSEMFNLLETNWRQIRDEGLSALNENGYFEDEKEKLLFCGIWKEFVLTAGGVKNIKNCNRAQFTCGLLDIFSAFLSKTGQMKFSVIHPGTHVKPHCGPNNLRLRSHLALKIPNGTKMRIGINEIFWEEGKFLIFDDSFEHELWHNGNSIRLILIVDIWHPEVTSQHRSIIENEQIYPWNS